MKKILAIILVLCTLFLSSCGILKELKAGMDEAIVLVEDFCTALSNDDFDTAKSYLHPDSTPKQDELSTFITKLEQTHSIDFSDGDLDKLEQSVKDNVFKVKCLPFYDLVGKTFTITAERKYSSKSLIVEVISL